MKNLFCISLFFFLTGAFLSADTLSYKIAGEFVKSLTGDRTGISEFVLPEELKISERLGIEYTGIDNKFLISTDIDPSTRKSIKENSSDFTFKIERLDSNYSKLILSITSQKYIREYYFKGSKLISSPFYFGRNWFVEESKYFIFHISNPILFNNYAEERLDRFVDEICKVLNLSNSQVKRLRENKIHYYLCRDDREIKRLTGYDARGLFYLPYDYIITTYNCHYHEILHLLMNYKLGKLPLYTLPLLQEGFAVAFGGRGGKEPDVILGMGSFIAENNFLNYNLLLTRRTFNQYDATMTYPLAGLYNKFLISNLGITKYITLYKKYSGDESEIEKLKISAVDLPPAEKWEQYFKKYSDSSPIKLEHPVSDQFKEIFKTKQGFALSENQNYYLFRIKDTLLLNPPEKRKKYQSKLFNELFPGKPYHWEKYAVIADSNEVSVYNFYSNNLIAKYVRSFSTSNKKVPQFNNCYQFLIKKDLFDKPASGFIFN